ncbi:hypothetical protein BTO22_13285 [Aliivibrio sifiae]|uniref:Pyosin/cloacin translocation domain-containing protein n=2 Tax=Aliivibrio sifiae TaxID=566293 RepID=A0A2S7X4V3_9GAMM|nr:hypothetical protein BTO22_13285 [Aliivibrio sifiae]
MKAEHLINREEFNQLSDVNTELKLRLQNDESGKEDLIAFHRDGEKLPVIQAEPNPESGSKAFKATLPSGVVIEWNGASKQGPLFHNGTERRFGSLRQEKVLPNDGKTQDIDGVSDDAVEEVIIAFPKQKFLEPLYLVLPKFKEESKITINPKNMYWPPYNPLAKEGDKELNIEYTQDIVKFAVLEPEEWTVFFDTFDKSKTVKDTVTGLYNARETAKALGGLGVTILVKNIDGVDYVILKNYDKWSQTLLHGGVFKANNAQVIKLGLGALDSVKGMARFVKVSAPMEILVGSGINVLQFIVNDEYTLKKLGVEQAKIFVNILAVSGLAVGAVYLFPILGATALYSGVTLVISSTVVWTVDKLTDFESKLIEKVLELSE